MVSTITECCEATSLLYAVGMNVLTVQGGQYRGSASLHLTDQCNNQTRTNANAFVFLAYNLPGRCKGAHTR